MDEVVKFVTRVVPGGETYFMVPSVTTPANAYVAEDGTTFYTAEDGVTYLIQES